MNRRREHGFSFVEIMVAVAVLALCAVPAADAVKNGLDASNVARTKAGELRCMKSMMETVLAEPYQKLSDAALGRAAPSSYSQAAGGGCVARKVYITRYEHLNGAQPVFLDQPGVTRTEAQLQTALLYVTVSSPDTAYTFTSLVAR